MGRHLKLTPSQHRALLRDYRAKVPTPELLVKYGVSKPTFYGYLKRSDEPRRRPECAAPKRPRRTYRPRAQRPEPQTFPFRWFPPKQPRIARWRCACRGISTDGPVCSRCRTQEAA